MGLLLVAGFWWASWHAGRIGWASRFNFFGLWLGYILTVDGWLAMRTGTSPLRRGIGEWLFLFLASVPVWWMFELLNRFLGNWQYLGTERYAPVERFLLSSLAFSTVIPAVMTTAELIASFALPRRMPRLGRPPVSQQALAIGIALGLSLLGFILVAPRYFFPATWLCWILILEPVNYLLGAPSLLRRLADNDWQGVWALALGALCCGFWWELWNFHADPKWVYHIPFFGRGEALAMPYLFEMPLPGYLGYLPFGVELYAALHFLAVVAGRPQPAVL